MIKKEMKMLDNGSYQEVISTIQHDCILDSWKCREYGWDIGKLILSVDIEEEDHEYSKEINVPYCPFCGYTPCLK